MTDTERAAALAAALVALHREEKRVARALVAAEAVTRRHARAAVIESQTAAQAALLEEDDPVRASTRVRAVTPLLIAGLAAALAHGAQGAEARAREAAGAPHHVALVSAGARLFAETTAAAIGAAWEARLVAVARKGSDRRVAADVRQAKKALASSVDRAAATETALAYSGELVRSYGRGPYREAPILPLRREREPERWVLWSAVLDRKTCTDCWRLHGTGVRAGDVFPSGPPPLHPWCRCVPVLLLLPASVRPADLRRAYLDEEKQAA